MLHIPKIACLKILLKDFVVTNFDEYFKPLRK